MDNKKTENLVDRDLDIKPQGTIDDFLKTQTNVADTKVADLLYFVGENKKYQKVVIYVLSIVSMIAVFMAYEMAFIFYEPNYLCYDKNQATFKCERDQACTNPFGFTFEADRTSLITEYRLVCDREDMMLNGRSAFLVGGSVGTIVFIVLTGIIGRLVVMYMSIFMFIGGAIMCYFTSSLVYMFVGLGFTFTGFSVWIAGMNIYLNETIGELIRIKYEKHIKLYHVNILLIGRYNLRCYEHMDQRLPLDILNRNCCVICGRFEFIVFMQDAVLFT